MLRRIRYRLITKAWDDPVRAQQQHEMLTNCGNATILGLEVLEVFGRQ